MKALKLQSGYTMPIIGLGTWQLTGAACRNAVKMALESGYTHIDTASMYENETFIGQAIKQSGADRSNLFITSKVSYGNLSYDDVIEECDISLNNLQTDYLDMYLIHWPNKVIPMRETFDAFRRLIEDYKVRSIGVSNFTINHLKIALEVSRVPISVNQVEYHPYLNQEELLSYCRERNIVVTAYSPLARGAVMRDETIKKIAGSKQVVPSQVVLTWLRQKDIIAIPKSSSKEHLESNIKSLEVELTDEEMDTIDSIKTTKRFINPGWSEFDR